MLICLKCEARIHDDDGVDGCPAVMADGTVCGAKEWLAIVAPVKPYKLSENDRRFLRVNRIAPEV